MIAPYTDEKTKRKKILDNYTENVLVMAGAGAGKTTMIVDRVINQLKDKKKQGKNRIKPEELVIITFTKAAAGELRDRLTKELDNALKNETDAGYKKNLQEAIDNQALIQVSTIHSFCLRLIKERVLDIDYPLDVEMMDEIETKARKDLFFSNWIKNLSKKENQLIEKNSNEFLDDDYIAYVYNTFMEIAELSKEIKIKYRDDILKSGKKLADYIDDMKEQVVLLYNAAVDYIEYKLSDSSAELIKKYVKGNLYKLVNETPIDIKGYLELYKKIFGTAKTLKDSPIAKNEVINLINGTTTIGKQVTNEFDEFSNCKNLLNELVLYQNALVTSVAVKAQKAYQEYLDKPENKHKLSNDQLLNLAYDLVCDKNNKGSREFFKKHIKYLYIDEYQDTDFIQRGIAYKLGQDSKGNFENNRLFFCGDAKQAIYAFRGADLNVYQSTYETFKDSPSENEVVYSLQENYRSEKTIIDWVNAEFNNPVYGIKDYEPMIPTKDFQKGINILNGIYTLEIPNDNNISKTKNATTEAVFIAKLIKYLINNDNYQINYLREELDKDGNVVKDENGRDKMVNDLRKIKYKDFLIISKGKKNLNVLSDTLKYFNIPINMNGALNFKYDETAVKYKILYHYLINKDDKKAAYAAKQVLMQSIFITNKKLANERLVQFTEKCKDKAPFELIEYLVHRSDLFMNKVTPRSEVENIESRLQQILEYLLSFDKLTYEGYDEALANLMQSSVDKELVLSSDNNAVRIMNRHKSKGLQGEIVISCLRTADKNDAPDSYRELCGNDYYYYPTARKDSMCTPYPAYINYDDCKQKTDRLNETIRLEYVEATRGKECVIFLDKLAAKGKSRFDSFDFSKVKKLTEIEEIKDLYDNNYNKKPELVEKTYDKIELFNNDVRTALLEEQIKPVLESVTPSSKDNYGANGWGSVEKANEERPDGNIFGVVLHRMFELAVNKIKNAEKNYDTCLNQALMENYADINEDERDLYLNYLKEQLDKFVKSDVVKLVKEAKEAYPEYEFSYIDGTNWINGKADLVLIFDNNIKIVDYKTDKIPSGDNAKERLEKHLEDAYGDQQRLYVEAIKKCFKVDEVTYQFYHLYN